MLCLVLEVIFCHFWNACKTATAGSLPQPYKVKQRMIKSNANTADQIVFWSEGSFLISAKKNNGLFWTSCLAQWMVYLCWSLKSGQKMCSSNAYWLIAKCLHCNVPTCVIVYTSKNGDFTFNAFCLTSADFWKARTSGNTDFLTDFGRHTYCINCIPLNALSKEIVLHFSL